MMAGMKRLGMLGWLAMCLVSMLSRAEEVAVPGAEALPEKRYLFAYHSGNGEDGLHLAWSADGYSWEALNKGQSFLKPQIGDSKTMRDPFLLRGPNGTFHLFWTIGHSSNTIGYASSTNLIDWSAQHGLPVMVNEPATLNCWAPEAFWDEAHGQFVLFWASTVTNRFTATAGQTEGGYNHRFFCARTRDFKTFTPSAVFYNPNFSATDATLVPAQNRFYLIFKDETAKPPRKQLRLAIGEHAEGPFGAAGPPFSREKVEGPACLGLGADYVVYFHDYQADRYGALKTRDFLEWEDVSSRLSMPSGMRHGIAMEISSSILGRLRALDKPETQPSSIANALGIGSWIWTTNVADKQTCRLWHSVTIPRGSTISKAWLRVTADNGYRVFLNGREIGRGGDWKYLTEFDLTSLLATGRNILAVEAINDAYDAGVMMGFRAELAGAEALEVKSDATWLVVPGEDRSWTTRPQPRPDWLHAQIVGVAGRSPWIGPQWHAWPVQVIQNPPLEPVVLRFWQRTWFLVTLVATCAVIAGVCVKQASQLSMHARAERLLERERSRIARDIHDDIGAGLTQLALLGEILLRDTPKDNAARKHVDALCAKSRTLLGNMDEIVWTVNPKLDTVSDFTAFVCQYVQEYLGSTELRCRLDVAEDLPSTPMDLPARRNLLMAVKEAVRNAARHSGGTELTLGVHLQPNTLEVSVEDNGRGFSQERVRPGANGLGNMRKRMAEIGGTCALQSLPNAGCRVLFRLPLTPPRLAGTWLPWPAVYRLFKRSRKQ
jgi:signal transduction histidine kinase